MAIRQAAILREIIHREATHPGGNTSEGNTNIPLTPDTESKYETDLSGATSTVNSSTTLPDGVYTPDRFTWSGGTGRVSLSCNKVTVTNGQAYATIAFSSSSYTYVKANGRTYYGTISGGKSIFVIPVELNKNNQIIGMTTKMSAAHEITYTIYVYLAAANADGTAGLGGSGNEKLDEEAPTIYGDWNTSLKQNLNMQNILKFIIMTRESHCLKLI